MVDGICKHARDHAPLLGHPHAFGSALSFDAGLRRGRGHNHLLR
jgi:hypothetical protein